MEWVKTTAKTLPEAIDLALDNLGVDESEAEIVVLEEPRQGLFGRMRGTARVEARVKPKAIRPKAERNRNRKGKGGGEGRNRSGGDRNRNRNRGRGGQGGGGNRNEKSSGNRNDNSKQNDNRSKAGAASGGGGGGRNESGQGDGGKGRNRSGGGNGGGGRNRSADQNGRSDRSNRGSKKNDESKPKEETPVEEVQEHLQTFLSGLTEAFGFDSPVTVDNSEADVLVGRIEGQHGLLVGPKGRTLDAVQELARISCQRTVPSSIRIKVDVGGYRQQRQDALAAFAVKAADSAVESGGEVALEPMSAADRKAIHDALSEDGRVETRSVGTDPRRKVLVVPVEGAEADEQAEDVVDEVSEDQAELVDAASGDEEE